MTLQQDVSKVSAYNLGYICTLLELLCHSESNGSILTLYAKVTINYGRIIATAGMHTKPCIASLAFTTCK